MTRPNGPDGPKRCISDGAYPQMVRASGLPRFRLPCPVNSDATFTVWDTRFHSLCLHCFSRHFQHLVELGRTMHLCPDPPNIHPSVGNTPRLNFLTEVMNGSSATLPFHLLPQHGSSWPNGTRRSAGWSLHRAQSAA